MLVLVIGEVVYGKIFALNTFSSLLANNAYLVILAAGVTFTILTGGIDLSVGAVLAFASVAGAMMLEGGTAWPIAALVIVLSGSLFGLLDGVLIRYFDFQPFIATLSSMFLARGLASIFSTEPVRVPTDSPILSLLTELSLSMGRSEPTSAFHAISFLIALVVVLIAYFLLHRTRFGRTVYGLGGVQQSAELMGLPPGKSQAAHLCHLRNLSRPSRAGLYHDGW